MGKDILVILMMAFGLFAILMFILFYIYAKKYYNEKHLTDDYEEDEEKEFIDIMINGKNYTFYANNENLKNGNKVKVMIDGKIRNGIVKRENYFESLSKIKKEPKLLEIVKNKKTKKVLSTDEMEFVPKKKKK